jgi:hypothetical protein
MMTYATVMVSMALERSDDARLEVAGQLAERFGAYVIGISAGEFSPPLYFTTGGQAQKVLDEGQAAIKKPPSSNGWPLKLAPVWSLQVPTDIRGFANGFWGE